MEIALDKLWGFLISCSMQHRIQRLSGWTRCWAVCGLRTLCFSGLATDGGEFACCDRISRCANKNTRRACWVIEVCCMHATFWFRWSWLGSCRQSQHPTGSPGWQALILEFHPDKNSAPNAAKAPPQTELSVVTFVFSETRRANHILQKQSLRQWYCWTRSCAGLSIHQGPGAPLQMNAGKELLLGATVQLKCDLR